MAPRLSHSVRRLQSLPLQGVVLRLPDPLDPGSTVYIPSDENSFGVLNYEAERALITQYQSVLDDIIRWFLSEPDRIGCQRFHAMRICRPPRNGSYTSQTQYICTQDELMLYAEAHVRGEEHAGIEAMEDWTRIYAVFLQHLGMTQLAADVRATLPSPVERPIPPPALPPSLGSPIVDDPSTNPNHGPAQSALQKRTSIVAEGVLEVTTGTLMALVCGACTCGAASLICVSRCRRTRGRRYQKVELQDPDQLDKEDPLEPTISGEQLSPASPTDILRAYAKFKQPREPAQRTENNPVHTLRQPDRC